MSSLRAEVDALRRALASRAAIQRAVGILMMRYGIDQVRAFEVLSHWSTHSNLELGAVAENLTEAVAEGHLRPVPVTTQPGSTTPRDVRSAGEVGQADSDWW